jgi:hypothetical protein
VRASLAAIAAVLALAVSGALVWYRATYHNWPWEGAPARLTACGRTYERVEGLIDRAAALENGAFKRLYPLFRAPPLIGHQVYSVFSPSRRSELREHGGAEASCAGLGVYLEEGPGRYRAYVLLGGP